MLVLAVLDPKASLTRQLRWALRLARACAGDVELVVPREGDGPARALPAAEVPDDPVAGRAAERLRELLRPAVAADAATNAGPEVAAAPTSGRVELVVLRGVGADRLLRHVTAREAELVVLFHGEGDPRELVTRDAYREVLQRAPCRTVLLQLGTAEAEPGPDVLVSVTRDALARTLLRFGRRLATAAGGRLTAAFVEPRIGGDAELVGHRVVDDLVRAAFGKEAVPVRPLVAVDDRPADGILRACEEAAPGVLVVGVARFALLGGRFFGNIAGRVMRKRPELDVCVVRDAMPFTNRLRQLAEAALQRIVPQLEREQRISLAERVQSTSASDFDFVALISLAAFIASFGLVQDSAPVVIGAMLVAPLMTPILGVGLALVHGNAALARIAFRSIGLGVGTAVLLGFLTGLLDPALEHPSREMLARTSPGILDLLVAFVSGLAAAYATSRPNLVAALPGVAIAASLVPPLATAGLFCALGEPGYAVGAALLFVTNMIAIVVASAISLWAVGVRSVKGGSRAMRVVGNALLSAVLLLSLYFGLAPRPGDPVPGPVVAAIRSRLEPAFARVEVVWSVDRDGRALLVRVAGPVAPEPGLAAELSRLAAAGLGAAVRVRLQAVWEAEAAGTPAGK